MSSDMTPATPPRWRLILKEQGRSLIWLADRTGRSHRAVYAYSRGARRTPQAWLDRVAVALDVPVSMLREEDAA